MLLLILVTVDLALILISPFTILSNLVNGGAKLTGQVADFSQYVLIF